MTDEQAGPAGTAHRFGPKSRKGRFIAVATIAVVLAVAAGTLAWTKLTSLPEDAAFAYGDKVVTKEQLNGRVESLRALYGVTPPADPAKRSSFQRDIAKSVAVSMILDHAGSQRNIVVSDKQARDVLDRFINSQFGEGGRDAFVRALGNVGTSERDVLGEIKRQLTVSRLMNQVTRGVTVSDQELRTAYEQRRNRLGTPEKRAISNVVVGSQQEANQVLGEIGSGAPIAALAARHSLDGSTRKTGGSLGELTRGQLEKTVGDEAFTAPAGGTYGPVRGKFGWNVGKVDRVVPAVPPRFDTIKESLRQTLKAEKALQRWRSWLGEQIRSAQVEYAPAYRPADPQAPPSAGLTGAAAGSRPR
jgi:peptidyl-prolyl cis-trans isomerase C